MRMGTYKVIIGKNEYELKRDKDIIVGGFVENNREELEAYYVLDECPEDLIKQKHFETSEYLERQDEKAFDRMRLCYRESHVLDL